MKKLSYYILVIIICFLALVLSINVIHEGSLINLEHKVLSGEFSNLSVFLGQLFVPLVICTMFLFYKENRHLNRACLGVGICIMVMLSGVEHISIVFLFIGVVIFYLIAEFFQEILISLDLNQ
jgi:hypothetical protein